MAQLHELVSFCDRLLEPGQFQDYCPNGLQVEGKAEVTRLVSGVTASLELIEAAVAAEADALLVHHGYFWKGEAAPLTGMKGRRISALMRNGLSLLAYHLPLDAHPEVGNNRQLAERLGLPAPQPVAGEGGLIWSSRLPTALPLSDMSARVAERLGREPLVISGGPEQVQRLVWCTGGAQGYIDKAAALGGDLYISGEISEPTVHSARELGLNYISAGHHATERYGVQALGNALSHAFDVEHQFIDIPNPV